MAITDTLKQKVSVIKNTSRPYFTYISRYGASSPFVMNGHLYDIKNIPRPEFKNVAF